MFHYFQSLTNTSGDSLVGYFARAIDPSTGLAVTLASDNGGTPIATVSGVANMAVTDDAGNLSFYVTAGTYHLDIYSTDATTFVRRVENVGMTAGEAGPTGPAGTLAANSGFTATGASTIQGDSATIFRILNADASYSVKVNNLAPFVSASGTRTTPAPMIIGGDGTDIGFDSFIKSNCIATGTTLFRDEFQDTSTFSSLNGAHASFDAYCNFIGAGDRNHHRGFQARGKLSITGTGSGTAGLPLLSEWTGFFAQPIFAGTWQIDQLVSGLWVRDAQVDSGTPSIVHAYGIKIDTLTKGSGTIYGLYLEGNDAYFGKNVLGTSSYTMSGFKEYIGLAGNFTGGYTSFQTGGGLLCCGKAGASDYAILRAYSNNVGATRGMGIITNNLVIGSESPTAGKQLDVAGGVDATDAYYVDGVKVVGNRDTGWTADTGTAKKTANATYAAGSTLTYSAAYVQAEQTATATRLTAIESALQDATRTIKALKDAGIAHGAIGA